MNINIENTKQAELFAQEVAATSDFPYEVVLNTLKRGFIGKGPRSIDDFADMLAEEMASYEINRLYKEGKIEPFVTEDGIYVSPTEKFNKEEYEEVLDHLRAMYGRKKNSSEIPPGEELKYPMER